MLTQLSLKYWRVVLGFCVVGMVAGLVSLWSMPVQLLPTIDKSVITISSSWLQNAPQDVEEQMAVQLENELGTLAGLKSMQSKVSTGKLITTVEFEPGADPIASLIATSAKLNQMRSWPQDATRPVITNDGISSVETVATLMLYPKDDQAVSFTLLDETVRELVIPEVLKVEGISKVDSSFSHLDKVIWVRIKPDKMAHHSVTLEQLKQAMLAIKDRSGGLSSLGKDTVAVRFKGKPNRQQLSQFIVKYSDGVPVHLSDLANFEDGYANAKNITMRNGKVAYYLSLKRGRGSNSFAIVQNLKTKLDELNQGELGVVGLELAISLDTSENIERAIDIVTSNLLLGAILVYLVLYFFIRKHPASLVVIASVPLTLLITIALLNLFGRSLNIISLAGLAFSVGLIIDAAVVVQEALVASMKGAKAKALLSKERIVTALNKVSRALFASTLTTLVIFIPISQLTGDVGQLLSDLALTMSIAIGVSILVSLCVVPLMYTFAQGHMKQSADKNLQFWQRLSTLACACSNTPLRRSMVIGLLIVMPLVLFPVLLPQKDLLPNAGDTLLRASISFPAGRDIKVLKAELADVVVERLRPYMADDAKVKVRAYNLVVANNFAFAVAYPQDPAQLDELIDIFKTEIFKDIVEVSAHVAQEPMIYFRSSSSKNIHLNIHGDDMSKMLDVARSMKSSIIEHQYASGVRITPSNDGNDKQLVVYPKNWQSSYYGLDYHQLGDIVSAYTGGLYAGEYADGKDSYDFYLKGPDWSNIDEL
ncbi:MAG: efflux RND transporter permease subunit, partial [Algicola sp.]|nr:efflux RND transporter permease subunit [Algicola sp.]